MSSVVAVRFRVDDLARACRLVNRERTRQRRSDTRVAGSEREAISVRTVVSLAVTRVRSHDSVIRGNEGSLPGDRPFENSRGRLSASCPVVTSIFNLARRRTGRSSRACETPKFLYLKCRIDRNDPVKASSSADALAPAWTRSVSASSRFYLSDLAIERLQCSRCPVCLWDESIVCNVSNLSGDSSIKFPARNMAVSRKFEFMGIATCADPNARELSSLVEPSVNVTKCR